MTLKPWWTLDTPDPERPALDAVGLSGEPVNDAPARDTKKGCAQQLSPSAGTRYALTSHANKSAGPDRSPTDARSNVEMNTDATQTASCREPDHMRNPRRRGRPPIPPDALATGGAMMRSRREELGWTLTKVGNIVGVCIVHLSEVERGRKGASASVLEDWAKAIGLDTAEVLCAFRVVPDRVSARFFDPARMREALESQVSS